MTDIKEKIKSDLDKFYGGRLIKPPLIKETILCHELARAIGGATEVVTPVGRIDLLRDDLILEAKISKYAKHAIGQLMCYSIYHERPNKAIGIIGFPPPWLPKVCEKLDLILLYYCFNTYRWYLK